MDAALEESRGGQQRLEFLQVLRLKATTGKPQVAGLVEDVLAELVVSQTTEVRLRLLYLICQGFLLRMCTIGGLESLLGRREFFPLLAASLHESTQVLPLEHLTWW